MKEKRKRINRLKSYTLFDKLSNDALDTITSWNAIFGTSDPDTLETISIKSDI